jgi:hypothetical protein
MLINFKSFRFIGSKATKTFDTYIYKEWKYLFLSLKASFSTGKMIKSTKIKKTQGDILVRQICINMRQICINMRQICINMRQICINMRIICICMLFIYICSGTNMYLHEENMYLYVVYIYL